MSGYTVIEHEQSFAITFKSRIVISGIESRQDADEVCRHLNAGEREAWV